MKPRDLMSRHRPAGMLLLTVALLTLAPSWATGETTRAAVGLGPGSVLWIEGTSTLHDYESRTSALKLSLQRDAAQADPADVAALDAWLRAGGGRGLDLVVPVTTMRSGKDGLDKNLFKALKTTEYPDIRFQMSGTEFGTAQGDTLPVSAKGTLSIAGQQRDVTVQGRLIRTGEGVWLEGSHPMKMTDFEVKPPKLMMGTIKVHDPIVVRYRLLLVPGAGGGK